MTKKQFEKCFLTLTRCIFTAITAEAAFLITAAVSTVRSFTDAGIYRSIPVCLEHLTAGIVLYLLCAIVSSAALREYHT